MGQIKNSFGKWILTYLSQMECHALINWINPFQVKGLLGSKFQFHSNFNGTFCEQTVQNLIRCLILQHLIWFYTVCRCPIKRILGLNRLTIYLFLDKYQILLFPDFLIYSTNIVSNTVEYSININRVKPQKIFSSISFFYIFTAERVREEKLKLICIPTSFQVGW